LYDALRKKNSIALYRSPGEEKAYVLIGKAKKLEIGTLPDESGFALAPFHATTTCPGIWLPGKAEVLDGLSSEAEPFVYKSTLPWHVFPSQTNVDTSSEQSYKTLVKTAMDAINRGIAQKIVTSRRWSVTIPDRFDPLALWVRVSQAYPDAFVSLVSTPLSGTWLCASPELLVSQDLKGTFRTVALAGTQPAMEGLRNAEALWTHKEIEEQALVSRYIIQAFKHLRLREFVEEGPFTIQAAHLLHLKTTFEVDTIATGRPGLLQDMLSLLHPTSAVCGMPREQALDFLLQHEEHPRAYYSGYLGPVHQANGTSLFVQLRCMQYMADQVFLYAGGGITAQSDVDKEWKETEYKLQTLSSLLSA
jgi:isochorismate synthase